MEDFSNEGNTYQLEDLTIKNALTSTFVVSRNHNKLSVGATEVAKCLERVLPDDPSTRPELVVLAQDLEERFKTIILSQCERLSVPVIYIDDRRTLASMLPIKRIRDAGAVCIRDFICESREKAFIINTCRNA